MWFFRFILNCTQAKNRKRKKGREKEIEKEGKGQEGVMVSV